MLLSNNNALTYFKNLTRSHEMMKSSRLQYAKPALRFRKETKWPKKKKKAARILFVTVILLILEVHT